VSWGVDKIAKNLANAAANLGIDSYQLAKGGWKITRENIEKLIPDLKELMSSLPVGTSIILFCLDNSSFLAASEEGGSGCNKDRIEQILRSGWADPVHPKPHIYSKMALNLIEKVAAASIPTGSQKRKRSESSEEGHSSRAAGPPSRGGQGPHNRPPGNRGGSAVHSAPHPPGSNRAANSGNSLHSHQSWNPPRGRGQYQGRGEARGRGYAVERGRGSNRGGQPRRGWGRPWSRW
jgi:hypothetical protein